MLSFAREQSKLAQLATELGERAATGTAADALAFGEAVIVPWTYLGVLAGTALAATGLAVAIAERLRRLPLGQLLREQ